MRVSAINGDFDSDADALAAIADRLADASIDLLTAAVRDGDGNVADRLQRELQKARRAVVKAEGILRGISSRRDD
ncbi:MAG: hypothetical protein FJW44_05110 [Actinobacteria bacterium]|nr:hypothetical protein [Actinomycetota bacterium]